MNDLVDILSDFGEVKVLSSPEDGINVHSRFKRKVWAFRSDFTGSLAKWLVKQSPYTVPDNLATCIEKFDKLASDTFGFDCNEMIEIELIGLTKTIYQLLEQIPEVMALNERKNGREGLGVVSRFGSDAINPDDDFIDILAVAQNITCDFATDADCRAYLDQNPDLFTEQMIKDLSGGVDH
ncbi:MAG: hypothetical protein OEZ43_20965 [Gammaproteobacteria bacterium]|nr:hypothetical protein [Gammaproteobacteria bacterium]